MVKPLPSRVLSKPASRLSWPRLLPPEAKAKPTRANEPVAQVTCRVTPAPAPDADADAVPGVWSLAEIMRKEPMSRERKLEPNMSLPAAWRPRRPAVVGAVASFCILIFLAGIGARLMVGAVPEAAAASAPDEVDGRRRADLKARAAPASAVTGASCDSRQPASVVTPPAPAPPVVDSGTDLGDLGAPPAEAAPVLQARRPARPPARPAVVSAPPRRPAPTPTRAAPSTPTEQRTADTLFAGRL